MNSIQQATQLIASIDPCAARVFAAQPANRHSLVTALHASLAKSSTYARLADQIAVALRSAIDQSKRAA